MNNKPLTNNKIDRIISMDEVATILNRSSKTLWRWHAKEKIIPRPLMVNGRSIGYRASTIEAILISFQKGGKA